MADKKLPSPVDVHVGSRIRLRRMMQGMSQERLGEALGITFQQIQKYEKGINRVGASRLHQMADALAVPVSFFFEGMGGAEPSAAGAAPMPAEFDTGDIAIIKKLRNVPPHTKAAIARIIDSVVDAYPKAQTRAAA